MRVSISETESPPLLVVFIWFIQFAVFVCFRYKFMLCKSAQRFARGDSSDVRVRGKQLEADCKHTDLILANPRVCIQLPLYNEPKHASRLLESVFKIDYPDEKLEIQILDDSDDHTSRIVRDSLAILCESRPLMQVRHLQRGTRKGYKAGALNYGLSLSDADYFVIFDCDFRPEPCFLKKILLEFAARSLQLDSDAKKDFEEVVCVQAGWTYYNDGESCFTRSLSLLLNVHFYMEHAGRSANNYLFNFNGTAGAWKGESLKECGGWSDHSVTEDLYLSYMAYLCGKRLAFCLTLNCASELPSDMGSFLVQQRRWAKGNGQVLRLLGLRLLLFKGWSLRKKADVVSHLLGYALTSLVLLGLALAPFWIYARSHWVTTTSIFQPFRILDAALWLSLSVTLLGVYSHPAAHFSATKIVPPGLVRLRRALFLLLIAPCISVLLCWSYWEGVLLRPQGAQLIFKRTPKTHGMGTGLRLWDHATMLVLAFYFLGLSILSLNLGFYTGALLFFAHGCAIAYLWAAFGARFARGS